MPSKYYKKHMDEVFSRDNYTCRACGFYSDYGMLLSLDHIIPQAKGGSNKANNLQCLCVYCNSIKSNMDAPYLPIRERPAASTTLGTYNKSLLENRKQFFASIYGKESKGWFLRQEKTLHLVENGWKTQAQFLRLWKAIRATYKAPRGGREWAINKLQEYKNLVLMSTPADMHCEFAY